VTTKSTDKQEGVDNATAATDHLSNAGANEPNAQATADAAGRAEQGKSTSELVEENPKIFGEAEAKSGTDRKTPLERQTNFATLTADQRNAAENKGKPLHKPAKTEGQQIELGDRVIVTTATPIGGQTDNAFHVIGFNPQGLPNLRMELLDGGMGRPIEFGGVPQGAPREERGPYWRWPEEFAAKKSNDKSADKA